MEDFARAVGLSRPTVSKFFHDPKSVRVKTRGRIEDALKKTGFRPNMFAINLNRRRTKIIGLVIPDPMDPFYMALARRIELMATEKGLWAVLLSTNGEAKLEARAIETIQSFNAGGAIIASVDAHSHRTKLKALSQKVPLVFVDAPLDDRQPFVGTDNFQTIPLVTEYLCRTGEPPAYFDMPTANHNVDQRRDAYATTMRNLGLVPHIVSAVPGSTWEVENASYVKAAAMLRSGNLPARTFLCASDRVAFGVMAAINETGERIGAEPGCAFRVAGHDNHRMSAFTAPPLTTVSQDVERIGELALDLLLSRMDQGEAPARGDHILVSGELVIRRSA